MKRILISALAAASLAAAVSPALAQPLGGGSIHDREARIADRIEEGDRSGQLEHHQANRLRRELRKIEDIEHFYRRSGDRMTDRERADLQARLDVLSTQVFGLKHDGDRR